MYSKLGNQVPKSLHRTSPPPPLTITVTTIIIIITTVVVVVVVLVIIPVNNKDSSWQLEVLVAPAVSTVAKVLQLKCKCKLKLKYHNQVQKIDLGGGNVIHPCRLINPKKIVGRECSRIMQGGGHHRIITTIITITGGGKVR